MANRIKIEITFTEELLGTASGNPEVFREFIANKAPKPQETADDEVKAVEAATTDEEIENKTTVFPCDDDGKPFLYDYQIKGFFKDACGSLRRVKDKHKTETVDGKKVKKIVEHGTSSSNFQAYQKKIDGLIFVFPRRIYLQLPEEAELGFCERPLRAQTAKGERIALARSQTAPAGTKIVVEIEALVTDLLPLIEEWLDYGRLRGMGCWRNSGKGRFDYKYID